MNKQNNKIHIKQMERKAEIKASKRDNKKKKKMKISGASVKKLEKIIKNK